MLVVTRAGVTNGLPSFTTTEQPGAVVRRTTGFQSDFEYVAEATAQTASGDLVTAREFGHTADGALARAKASAVARLTGRKNACGFTAEGFRERTTKATFPMGFAREVTA